MYMAILDYIIALVLPFLRGGGWGGGGVNSLFNDELAFYI